MTQTITGRRAIRQRDSGFNANRSSPAAVGVRHETRCLDYGVVKKCAVCPNRGQARRKHMTAKQSSMKHHSTRAMFDYWNRRQGRRLVAARSDIDPTDIADVLPDAFLLSADFTDEIRFCVAGSRVCALFVRELKGESFKTLWANAGRGQVDAILNCVTDENEALVAGVLGRTEDGAAVELELLLLPLAPHERSRIRAVGTIAPLTLPPWLRERPLIELDVQTLRNIGVEQTFASTTHFQARKEELRTRHGFLVYRGGRELRPGERSS